MALSNHFKNINIKAHFYTYPLTGVAADIIFQGIRCGTFVSPDNRPPCRGGRTTLYFAIVDRKDAHLKHLYQDMTQSNILYRHQSVTTVLQHIADSLRSSQPTPEKTRQDAKLTQHEPLTLREQEVLHHLKLGKTPACVASFLGIKEKTISAHKRAAMKKLNFKRTNELFHWMIQGGLAHHQPRKGN